MYMHKVGTVYTFRANNKKQIKLSRYMQQLIHYANLARGKRGTVCGIVSPIPTRKICVIPAPLCDQKAGGGRLRVFAGALPWVLLGFASMARAPLAFFMVLLLAGVTAGVVSLWVNPADWRKPRQRRRGIIHRLRTGCAAHCLAHGLAVLLERAFRGLCALSLPLSRACHPQLYNLPARTVPPSWWLAVSLRLSGRLVVWLYRAITALEPKNPTPCKTPWLYRLAKPRRGVQ